MKKVLSQKPLTADEERLLHAFRQLAPEAKEQVLKLMLEAMSVFDPGQPPLDNFGDRRGK